MATGNTRYIPPEITDRIIGSVEEGSNDTFLSCALVCHAWLPASRLRLFRTVLLSPPSYDLFNASVVHSHSMEPWLKHIHTLRYNGRSSGAGDEAGGSDGSRDMSAYAIRATSSCEGRKRSTECLVHDLAGRLPNVATLHLENVDWVWHAPHPSIYIVLSAFPAIHMLTLFKCTLAALRAAPPGPSPS